MERESGIIIVQKHAKSALHIIGVLLCGIIRCVDRALREGDEARTKTEWI